MKVLFDVVICLEYDLRDGETLEDLGAEVLDQIRTGEYFPSRVKDVRVASVQEAS